MFGENNLIGLKKIKINSNNTIKLPEFTTVTDKERLFFYQYENDIRIYSELILSDKSKKLFESLKSKVSPIEYLKYQRWFFGILLSMDYVNPNRIITIPKKVRKHLSNTIYVKGCIDHLRLFNSIDEVKKYELTLN